MDFFNHNTITVWNAYMDPEKGYETYYPHVIDKVNLVVTKGANITTSGIMESDSAKVYIPKSVMENYKKPKEWIALSDEDKTKYFTFTPSKDFFANGEITFPITEANKFKVYEAVKKAFDDVYKVTTVDVYEDVLPKLVVGGV